MLFRSRAASPQRRLRTLRTLAEAGVPVGVSVAPTIIEVDGVRHCHVLDPRTGRSAQGFQSVSVHAPACLVAGSATTVAMLKGEAEGLAWLEALGLPFHAILADGRVAGRHPG